MQNDRYRKRMFKEEEHENDIENPGDPAVSMHGHYVDADPGVGADIINGMTETTIVPQGTGTRAQMATMLMRYSN
ncbi:MAG: hypothetical protein IIY29_06585 [Firmicutes bacterium]|nr:hypothetical protein [Bacillota bacterium]